MSSIHDMSSIPEGLSSSVENKNNSNKDVHTDVQTGSTNANGCNTPPQTHSFAAYANKHEKNDSHSSNENNNLHSSSNLHLENIEKGGGGGKNEKIKAKKKVSNIFGNAFSRFACRGEKLNKNTHAHSSHSSGSSTHNLSSGIEENANNNINNNNNNNNVHHHKEKEKKEKEGGGGGIMHLPHPHLPHLHLHKHDSSAVHTHGGGGGGEMHEKNERKTQELLKLLDDAKKESEQIVKKAYKQKDVLSQRARKEAEEETLTVRAAVERDFKLAEERGERETEQKIKDLTKGLDEQTQQLFNTDKKYTQKAVEYVTSTVLTVDTSILPTAVEAIARQHRIGLMEEKRRQQLRANVAMSSTSSSSSSSRKRQTEEEGGEKNRNAYSYILGGRMNIDDDDLLLDLSSNNRQQI